MDINDLTIDEAQELLNTDFGSEMEKEASAIVAAEEYFDYGAEMAKEAAVNMEGNYEQEGEDDSEYESEKVAEADACAETINEGFVSELMKLGEANYGDPMIYLEEMAKEAGIVDSVKGAYNAAIKGTGALAYKAKRKAGTAKDFIGRNAKKGSGYNDLKKALLKNKQMKGGGVGAGSFKEQRNALALLGAAKATGTAGLAGGAGYGGYKGYKKYNS